MMCRPFQAFLSLSVALIFATAEAANRLSFRSEPLLAGASGEDISVISDNDIELTGFSLGINYDEAALTALVVSVDGTVSEGAEFLTADIDTAQGLVGAGVVFSLTGAWTVPAGAAQPIAKLTVDVLATEDSSTAVAFETVTLDGARVVENVFSDAQGLSVLPELSSALISIETRQPRVFSIVGNSGLAGTEFLVEGEFFGEPELSVRLCGQAASAVLLPEGALHVVAPVCEALGFVPLEVSTVRGSAEVAEGFFYETPPAPVISGYLDNEGGPGDTFTILGKNFHPSGLAVTVCGHLTEGTLTPEGSIEATVPECDAIGPVAVEVCTAFGCVSDPEGLHFVRLTPFRRGDANDDTRVDVSDGVFTLLFLFRGRPPGRCFDAMDTNDDGRVDLGDPISLFDYLFRGDAAPAAPFPEPGLDPTADGLQDC